MLRLFLCALVPAVAAFRASPVVATRHSHAARHAAPLLAEVKLDPAREKLVKGGLPQKFAERVSFQSSGQRIPDQEVKILECTPPHRTEASLTAD